MFFMLRITGDAPAAAMLNGQLAGELTAAGLELPVGHGEIFLQLFPLERGCLPLSLYLTVAEEPTLRGAGATLCIPGKNCLHLRAQFERVPRETPAMPYLLQKTSVDASGLSASVYFDRTFNFALERNGEILLSGAFSLGKLVRAEIRRRGGVLLIQGYGGEEGEFFAVSLGERTVILHRRAVSAELREDFLEYTAPLGAGVVSRERFSLGERKVVFRDAEFSGAPGRIFPALLLGVRGGYERFSMSLIAPGLKKDAAFADFRGFLGDFAEFYREPTEDTAELCCEISPGVYAVRRLRASMQDGLIRNIDEIE